MRNYANRPGDIDETPGGDSFLDIVANIVGILVLLVVVVGVRAGQEVLEPVEEVAKLQTEELKQVLHNKTRKIQSTYQDSKRLAAQLGNTLDEIELRNQTREELAYYIATLKEELKQEREKLSANDRRTYELGNQITQLEIELEKLTSEQLALAGNLQEPLSEEIYFDPTPIVHSQVEDQIMLRLKDGRITYLPMDELYEEFARNRGDLRNQLSRQRGRKAMIQMNYGPLEGFLIRAIFGFQTVTSGGSVYQQASLVVARLEEQGVTRSEAVESLLEPGSPLTTRLEKINPRETVITLVAYPDSYAELPEVEKKLRQRGYQVAKALQEAGEPIEFSPNGRSTVLQ